MVLVLAVGVFFVCLVNISDSARLEDKRKIVVASVRFDGQLIDCYVNLNTWRMMLDGLDKFTKRKRKNLKYTHRQLPVPAPHLWAMRG